MSYPRKATISNRDGFPCWCSRLFQRSALQQNAARRNAHVSHDRHKSGWIAWPLRQIGIFTELAPVRGQGEAITNTLREFAWLSDVRLAVGCKSCVRPVCAAQ